MILEPTVLILGAGASFPYDFPTGPELMREVKKRITEASFTSLLVGAGISHDEMNGFSALVLKSGRSSVDAALESRKDLWRVGKAAIAATLIPHEREENLFTSGHADQDWYRYLFSTLSDGLSADEFAKHQVSFITYNYERSFEHFFFESIRHTYNLNDDELRRMSERFPVVHVHGRIGCLPWQGNGARAYGPVCNPDVVRVFSEQIRVIAEDDIAGGLEYDRARQLLQAAAVVCFLGFGYLKLNIDRLRVADWRGDVVIHGSAFGSRQDERNDASKWLRSRLIAGNDKHTLVEYLRTSGYRILH